MVHFISTFSWGVAALLAGILLPVLTLCVVTALAAWRRGRP
jgi:hypothetical protein